MILEFLRVASSTLSTSLQYYFIFHKSSIEKRMKITSHEILMFNNDRLSDPLLSRQRITQLSCIPPRHPRRRRREGATSPRESARRCYPCRCRPGPTPQLKPYTRK